MEEMTLKINGKPARVRAEPDTPLLDVLRNHLGLVGAKFGCGLEQCGSCMVLIDGTPEKSCGKAVSTVAGKDILTIEGVAKGEHLHPVQAALVAHDGMQCGFCTPGQVMSAIGLLTEGQAGSDPERIREGMSGNLCRCGAYAGITEAVLDAQKTIEAAKTERAA